MKKSNSIFGYILIIVGILLPLSLTSMMAFQEFAAKKQYEKYISARKQFSIAEIEKYNKQIEANKGFIPLNPFEDIEFLPKYGVEALENDPLYGYIIIPQISMKRAIYAGSYSKLLSKGPTHVYGTSLPLGKSGENSIIMGERVLPGDLSLLLLGELKKGDEIYLDTPASLLTYRVETKKLMKSSENIFSSNVDDKARLSIVTGNPVFSSRSGYLVIDAVKVAEEPNHNFKSLKYKGKVSAKTKLVKGGIYFLTVIGLVALVVVVFKLFKTFKSKK